MKHTLSLFMAVYVLIFSACKKQDEWLNIKSNKADITPSTLTNYQAILDYTVYMNDNYPGLPLVSADNYYLNYTTWLGNANYSKNAYIWAQDIYQGAVIIGDWNSPYINVEYANIVLDGIAGLVAGTQNQQDYNNIKGSAMFFRAYAFYNLVSEFAKPFNSGTAESDPGIPIRLSPDISVKSIRSSILQTFTQIITDLKEAIDLLPVTPLYQTRPSKTAAEALLARVYLNMDDYSNAQVYADKALTRVNSLIDFNTLPANASKPLPAFPNNPEIIFFATNSIFSLAIINGLTDSVLLKSYSPNDLRKSIFYTTGSSGTTFKGQYTGSFAPFGGLAVNELYLIRAECLARQGNTAAALRDLNTLLIKRWKSGTFGPYTATGPDDALLQVLTERRKELPFTGSLRWEDLRRLNKDSRLAKTLTRLLNGQTYTLAPGDNRYVMPIPDNEIQLSGIAQNPR